MGEKFDVAIIGAGRMGQIHGPNAARHPDLRLRYVVETDQKLGKALSDGTGAALATLDDVLGDVAEFGRAVRRRRQVQSLLDDVRNLLPVDLLDSVGDLKVRPSIRRQINCQTDDQELYCSCHARST